MGDQASPRYWSKTRKVSWDFLRFLFFFMSICQAVLEVPERAEGPDPLDVGLQV